MPLPEIPELASIDENNLDYSIALIIDGTVYQVLNTDGNSAAQFMSQPVFVQVDKTEVAIGDKYDATTGAFTK
jgi:hypothetical protein